MKADAVVITGAGCTLPGSPTVDAFWQRLLGGDSAITAYRNPRISSRRMRCFGHVSSELSAASREATPFKLRRYASACSQWGLRAMREAISSAGLDLAQVPEERRGLFTAQGDYLHPSLPSFEEGVAAVLRRGQVPDAAALAREFFEARGAEPFFAIKSLANNLLAVASLALRLRGDCGAFVQDESAPWAALRSAALSLRDGDADIALVACAGSYDEALTLAELQAQGRLSECDDGARSLRPFDVRRDGGIPGEGAIALVLETAAHAAQRGARPLAVVAGIGSGVADDDHVQARCLRHALQQAALPAEVLDAVVADGRGEREADAQEARRIRALPAHCTALPITAPTPITGSVPGCPLGLLAAIVMLQHQLVPPIAHLEAPEDPSLPWVLGTPRQRPLRHLLVLESGWLGSHSAVVLSRPGEPG